MEHGQHVSLYTRKSLEHIASKSNLNFYTNGTDLHGFFDSGNFPKYLPSKWMSELNKLTNNEFKQSYEKVNINMGSLKRNLHFHFKYGKIVRWIGNEEDGKKLANKIASSEFNKDFIEHMLTEGQKYWPVVKIFTKSKTFDDMLWVRDVLLKKLSAQSL